MTITQEVLEQSCLGLISYSGAAKSDYLEAVECAKSGDFEQAEAAIERGNENYLHAHEAHFGLLQEETGTEGGLLNIPFSPQMKLLPLFSGYFPFHFQILEDYHIRMVILGICGNRRCLFTGQLHVQPPCIIPSALYLSKSMFPLKSADSSQHTVHLVFFTGEIDKFSSQDSSI